MNRWQFLHKLLINRNHSIGAEIGTFKGETAKFLAKKLPNLEMLYCIDPWITYDNYEVTLGRNKKGKDFNRLYEAAKNTLKEFNNVKIIKEFSSNAVLKFDDYSLDFVFIDGNHAYEYVLQDIMMWYTKIKNGGIISGHDYGKERFGVTEAVNEFFGKNNIKVGNKNTVWYCQKN